MAGLSYLDFDLLIQREGDSYRAKVLNSPGGQATVDFSLPFTGLEVENFLLRVGRSRRATRGNGSQEVDAATTFGERLFEAAFGGQVESCFRTSLHEASRDGKGLRIRLRLTEAPELADLPWEYLHNPAGRRFLSLSIETPLVRYLEFAELVRPLAVTPPLRVLVMISSPTDWAQLDVKREWANLKQALADVERNGLVRVERLPEATLLSLQRQLRRTEYHIFHFVGHGSFDPRTQDGTLILEDQLKRGVQVSGHYLGTILHDHRSLRLALLNACEGARTSRSDPFAGVANTLVQQGVPAVIAMQFEITDEAAITLAREFYSALADGYPVDSAVAEARKAIFAQGNHIEWGTPVLYMRSADGVLFNLAEAPAVQASPEPPGPPAQRPRAAAHPPRRKTATASTSPAATAKPQPPTASSLAVVPESATTTALNKPELILPIVTLVDSITGVPAFSPDLTMLAAGTGATDEKGSVQAAVGLWSITEGKRLGMLEVPGAVCSTSFSPDGKLLAAGGAIPYCVRLWGVADRKLLHTLVGHTSEVNCLTFSHDSSLLASGSDDKTIKMWTLPDGRLLRSLIGCTQWIKSVAFSPDGSLLASGPTTIIFGPELRLWKVLDGECIRSLSGYSDTVTALAFSPDGSLLAAGSTSSAPVRVWNVSDGNAKLALQGHTASVNCVAFSPDGELLASGAYDKTVRLWSLSEGKLLHTLGGHGGAVKCVAFSRDGALLASCDANGSVRRWRLTSSRASAQPA